MKYHVRKAENYDSLLEKNEIKLIYIAYKNVSVFDSQVTALLNHFIENEKVDEIILLVGVNYKSRFEQNKITNLNEKIKTKYYVHYPQYPIIERRTIASVSNILKQIKNLGYTIHVRNDVLAYYVYTALKVLRADTNNLIADLRGAGIEQMLEYSNKNIIIRTLKVNQRQKVFKALQKISVVSSSLSVYLTENWKIPKQKISVNNCLFSSDFFSINDRSKIRSKLGVNDEDVLVVFSSGGTAKWQENHMIADIADKVFKVLNLFRLEIDHKNIINRFVPYRMVSAYLSAADAAFIWRSNSIVNKVSSPVKFSEYMACGLPIIHNGTIDLIVQTTENKGVGISIKSIDEINYARVKEI